MRILDRYTLRQLIGPLVWCLALFVILYLVIDLFGHLDEVLRFKVPLRIIGHYYGAMLPLIFVQVAPFAMLMAVLYTVGNLNRHQELIAMRASGIGPWHIMRPLLITGLVLSGAMLVVNERLVPSAAVTVETLKDQYLDGPSDPAQSADPQQRTIRSLAVYGSGHTLLYAKSYDPLTKSLADVVILEHGPDLKIHRKVTARRAEWTAQGWRFLGCTVIRFGSNGRIFGKTVTYERKIIPLSETPESLLRADRQTQMMSSKELRAYIKRLGSGSRDATRKLRVDLHTKWAFPFACVVLVLLGAPLAVQPTRGGTLLGMGVAIAAALAFYGVQAICVAFGKGGWVSPAAAAWGANVLFGITGIQLLRRRLT